MCRTATRHLLVQRAQEQENEIRTQFSGEQPAMDPVTPGDAGRVADIQSTGALVFAPELLVLIHVACLA